MILFHSIFFFICALWNFGFIFIFRLFYVCAYLFILCRLSYYLLSCFIRCLFCCFFSFFLKISHIWKHNVCIFMLFACNCFFYFFFNFISFFKLFVMMAIFFGKSSSAQAHYRRLTYVCIYYIYMKAVIYAFFFFKLIHK